MHFVTSFTKHILKQTLKIKNDENSKGIYVEFELEN